MSSKDQCIFHYGFSLEKWSTQPFGWNGEHFQCHYQSKWARRVLLCVFLLCFSSRVLMNPISISLFQSYLVYNLLARWAKSLGISNYHNFSLRVLCQLNMLLFKIKTKYMLLFFRRLLVGWLVLSFLQKPTRKLQTFLMIIIFAHFCFF